MSFKVHKLGTYHVHIAYIELDRKRVQRTKSKSKYCCTKENRQTCNEITQTARTGQKSNEIYGAKRNNYIGLYSNSSHAVYLNDKNYVCISIQKDSFLYDDFDVLLR